MDSTEGNFNSPTDGNPGNLSGGNPGKPLRKRVMLFIAFLLIALFVILTFGKTLLIRQIKKSFSDNVTGTLDFKTLDIGFTNASVEDVAIGSTEGAVWIKAKKIEINYNLFLLLNPYTYEKVLKSIEIHDPEITLYSSEKGEWNLSRLTVIQRKKPTVTGKGRALEFDIPVGVHNGKFNFTDNRKGHKINVKATDVNGIFHYASDFSLRGDIKFSIEGEKSKIMVKGKYIPDTFGLYINVIGKDLDAEKWGNYILGDSSLKVKGGVIDFNVDVSSKCIYASPDPLECIDIAGEGEIRQGRLNFLILPDPIENVEVKLFLAKDVVRIKEGKGKYRDANFFINGKVFGIYNPVGRLFLKIPAIPLEKMRNQPVISTSPYKLWGTVSADIAISGPLYSPIVQGKISFNKVRAKDEIFRNGKGEFSYFGKTVKFDIDGMDWAEGAIRGMGWINAEKEPATFMIDLQGDNADVSRIAREFFPGFKIAGNSDFNVKLIGTIKDTLIFGDSTFREAKYEGNSLGDGNLHFLYADKEALISGLRLRRGNGILTSDRLFYDLSTNYVDFKARAVNFDIPTNILPSTRGMQANATGSAHIIGNIASPLVVGSFSNCSINVSGRNVEGASGDVIYGGNLVSVEKGACSFGRGSVAFSGLLSIGDKPVVHMVYSINSASLSDLRTLNPGFADFSSQKKLNLSGFVSGNSNKYNWALTGKGSLGNIVGFGDYNSGNSRFIAGMLGWKVEMGELTPNASKNLIKLGKGDFTLLAMGTPSNFSAYFHSGVEKGIVLGVPINEGVGSISYSSGTLRLEDTNWVGDIIEPGRDRRFTAVNDLYEITSYWGIDPDLNRVETTFSRMYFMPYMLEGATFTRDGWKTTVIKPIQIRNNIDPSGPYQAILGAPSLPGNIRQLKRTTDGGFPIYVGFFNKENCDGVCNKVPVFDLNITGTINIPSKRINLAIDGRNMNLGIIGNRLNLSPWGISLKEIRKTMSWDKIEGNGRVQGILGGSWNSPKWKGMFAIYGGAVNNEPFSFHSNFETNSAKLKIKDFRLTQSVGVYSGAGTITLGKKPALDLSLKAENGKLQRLLSFTPWKDIPARGLISGAINVRGDFDSPRIDGDLHIRDANIYNLPISDTIARLKSQAGGVVLEKFDANVEGAKIVGSGEVKNSHLNLEFHSDKFPLGKLRYFSPQLPHLQGEGAFTLRLAGSRNSPIVDLDFGASDFLAEDQRLKKAVGKIRWENNSLSLSPLALETLEGYWNLNGVIKFPTGKIPVKAKQWLAKDNSAPVFNITSNIKNLKVGGMLKLLKQPLQDRVDGSLEGGISLTGPLARPNFNMALSLQKGNIGEHQFDAIDAFLNYRKGVVQIQEIEYISPESHSIVTGQIDADSKQVNLNATVRDFPLGLFHPFFPASQVIDGKIDSTIIMSGDLEMPDIISNTHLKSATIGSFNFDDIGGHFFAEKGIVTFDDLAIQKGKRKINFVGRIPIVWRNEKIENTEDIEISTKLDGKDLDVFGLFIPYLQDTGGALRGAITVKGKYPDFSISGDTTIKDGKLKFFGMENPVENLNALIRFQGKKINVEKISGRLGDGFFNLTGSASLSRDSLFLDDLSFLLTGEDLTVIIPGLIKGKVDARLSLSGSQEKPVLGPPNSSKERDFLKIRNATISPPESKLMALSKPVPEREGNGGEAKNGRKSLALAMLPAIRNFDFLLGDDVWVDYKGLFIKSQGKLAVKKPSNENLSLLGRIAFKSGQFAVPFTYIVFNINNGFVQFGDNYIVHGAEESPTSDVFNPYLEMDAKTIASGYEIYMNYKGNLNDLKEAFQADSTMRASLNLYSIPILPQQAIIHLLLSNAFAGSTDNVSQQMPAVKPIQGVAILSNYLQGLLLTPITKQFGRTFALSEVYFEMGLTGTWALRIAKALDPRGRFLITYANAKGIQGDTKGIWGVEYKYRPGMRVRIEDVEGAFVYTLQGQVQFDNLAEFWREALNIVKTGPKKSKQKK